MKPAQEKHQLGMLGQKIAQAYLTRLGYKIIEENFVCRWGEIDLVAIKNRTLVFIEVRTRTSSRFLSPLETITNKKLRSLGRAAKYYLCVKKNLPSNWRLDCVGIVIRDGMSPLVDLRQNCLLI